jgi:hypothetical protein
MRPRSTAPADAKLKQILLANILPGRTAHADAKLYKQIPLANIS